MPPSLGEAWGQVTFGLGLEEGGFGRVDRAWQEDEGAADRGEKAVATQRAPAGSWGLERSGC